MLLQIETTDSGAGRQPARFLLGGQWIAADVVDRWPGDGYTYFKVAGDDGNTYILRHNEDAGTWELTLFQDPGAPQVAGTREENSKVTPKRTH